MKRVQFLLLMMPIMSLVVMCLPLSVLYAQESPLDVAGGTAGWECKWCPVTDVTAHAEIELGAGFVTEDSMYGDYTGLGDRGGYAIAAFNTAKPPGDAGWSMSVEGQDLTLDSRRLLLSSESAGVMGVALEYDQIPRQHSAVLTPYQGESQQVLPVTWVSAATTGGMSQLNSSLHEVVIGSDRKNLNIDAVYHPSPQLSYELSFHQLQKQGIRIQGLALGNVFVTARSALLTAPVDQESRNARFNVALQQSRLQTSFSLEVSEFTNAVKALRWENAFSEPVGVSQGQAGAEPGNDMQRLSAQASYIVSERSRAFAGLAYGRMGQDESFLPYTVNVALTPSALPRNSLRGEIFTFDLSLGFLSALTERLQLQASYIQQEQDNNTDRATYTYVSADTAISGDRANFPYSFRKRLLQTQGRYKFSALHRITAGYDYEWNDRTYQEISSAKEQRLWGAYVGELQQGTGLNLKLEHLDRMGERYSPVAEIVPAENPALRKYNMADRIRDRINISVSSSTFSQVDFALQVEMSMDEYDHSAVGLLDSKERSYSVNLNWHLSRSASITSDYNHTVMRSSQAGSQAASSWYAQNDETVNTIGLGLQWQFENRTNLGLSYDYSRFSGETRISEIANFPQLLSSRHSLALQGHYVLDARSGLNTVFRYEKYREEDWALQDVAVDTLDNVLSVGEGNPDYRVWVVALSYNMRF
ncbi:MAG: MtrB/PioB family decaheme-associated outer membrane protein [Gammaproteobacteria bacterium]|nr:MtrB/PioB family decaheme-associated outer membrane protein [Gammaproteobacteria bacterium]MDH5799927.1 MtrB/PioB family decaheme-associated outer membrane protein [Gammaproteobacteria bacterium]